MPWGISVDLFFIRSILYINPLYNHFLATQPLNVFWFYKPVPHFGHLSMALSSLAIGLWRWSRAIDLLGDSSHRATISRVRGHGWAGQVRWNVPALLPGATQVCWAQFIPQPWLFNRTSHWSLELRFVINVFNSQPVHIIPLKTEEQPSRSFRRSLRLILDGNHVDPADSWQGIGLYQRWTMAADWLLFKSLLCPAKLHRSSTGSGGQLQICKDRQFSLNAFGSATLLMVGGKKNH